MKRTIIPNEVSSMLTKLVMWNTGRRCVLVIITTCWIFPGVLRSKWHSPVLWWGREKLRWCAQKHCHLFCQQHHVRALQIRLLQRGPIHRLPGIFFRRRWWKQWIYSMTVSLTAWLFLSFAVTSCCKGLN